MQLAVVFACVFLFAAAVQCAPQPRSISCTAIGDTGCHIQCLLSSGHWNGACDEDNNCICEEASYYVAKNEENLVKACLLIHGECTTEQACGHAPQSNLLCGSGETCCFWI